MKPEARMVVFLLGAAGFALLYSLGARGLPNVGDNRGPYRTAINDSVLPERHVTDAVTAVNFDYRGIDTLGEEFILFASVIGAVMLLRQTEDKDGSESQDESPSRNPEPKTFSDSVRVWALGLTGPTVLFGLYVVTHGQLTPGGGFQGGVILATAPLLIFLAGDFKSFKRIAEQKWVEIGECLGAAGFALLGLGPMIVGARFLENVLPLGSKGSAFSGGLIPLISLVTGLEVAGGFVLLLSAFLQEALARQDEDSS